MSTTHGTGGGYYDEKGNWIRTKLCFAPCGDSCDCMPPTKTPLRETDDYSILHSGTVLREIGHDSKENVGGIEEAGRPESGKPASSGGD